MLSVSAEKKGLALSCDISPDVYTKLKGDSGRLRQVLVNIVGNAIKFTSDGFVKISIKPCCPTQDGKENIKFEVEDTGIGIPPEQKHKLFTAFEQIGSSSEKRYSGTGLGLTISKSLVKLLGGDIDFESKFGEGLNFGLPYHSKNILMNKVSIL
mgnify:CR=1 FL=1